MYFVNFTLADLFVYFLAHVNGCSSTLFMLALKAKKNFRLFSIDISVVPKPTDTIFLGYPF
jgi:hypothetical protein